MNAEIYNKWEDAFNHFKQAEELLKNKRDREAYYEACSAIIAATEAIKALSKYLEIPSLSDIRQIVLADWIEFDMKKPMPRQLVEHVRKGIKRLSDELPPDTLRPFK